MDKNGMLKALEMLPEIIREKQNPEAILNKIAKEFGKGNNVIVNTTLLEKTQIQELSEALLKDSQYKGKVIVVNL